MISQHQWRIVGKCRYCGATAYYHDDYERLRFVGRDEDCVCELEGDPEAVLEAKMKEDL